MLDVLYGMNMLLWTSDVTEEHYPILEKLKKWGFDGVELPIFEMDSAKFHRLGKKLDEIGLRRTAVTVCTEAANPISADSAIRAAGLERLKKAIGMCAASGVKLLCGPIHSALGKFSGALPTDSEWEWAKEVLSNAAEYAKKYGVTLVVEPVNRFECYFATHSGAVARLCREVNHPNLKCMWDTFHAHIEEKSLEAAMSGCWDQVAHVHISECDRSTPGEGQVGWDETFRMLKKLGYKGWLTVEAFGLALPDLAAATKIHRRMFPNECYLATKALEFMKAQVAAAA